MCDTASSFDYDKQAYKITVECDSLEDASRYFERLSRGGQVLSPLAKMPWGDTAGHLRDAFGINWDIVYSP